MNLTCRITQPSPVSCAALVRALRVTAACVALTAACLAAEAPKSPAVVAEAPKLPAAAIALTRGAAWEYRAVKNGTTGPWTASLLEAVAKLGGPGRQIAWPTKWVTFTAWDDGSGRTGRSDDPASFTQVPADITLNGHSGCRATLGIDVRGTLDIAAGQSEAREGRWAYAFAEVETPAEQDVLVHASADGPMTWWASGKLAFQTPQPEPGKVASAASVVHSFDMHLAKGKQVLAVRVASSNRGWTMTSTAEPVDGPDSAVAQVQSQCVFQNRPATGPYVALAYLGPDCERVTLNGQPLPLPMPRMHYARVLGIPSEMLKPGRNELVKSWSLNELLRLPEVEGAGSHASDPPRSDPPREGALWALPAAAVEIHSGPAITRVTKDLLTFVCRTNAVVPVALKLDGRNFLSPAGLIHHLTVQGLKPGTAYTYTIAPAFEGASPTAARSGTACTLPAAGPLVLGMVGDGRGDPLVWGQIARGVANAKPNLVVYGGDIVTDGLLEAAWDRDFFTPGADLLANFPVYTVIGNHERNSPVYDAVFTESLGRRNWSQEILGVLLVGIDGMQDWTPDSPNAKWLDQTLAATKCRFIFAATHYPPYSSSTHGRLTPDGLPGELASRISRTLVLPILEKHHVTAVFGGHDHCYERSEPPGGVTVIITAGAGAGLYGKTTNPKQNPYSKVFAKEHHYCLLRIEGDTCTLTATALDGALLDTVTWKARTR